MAIWLKTALIFRTLKSGDGPLLDIVRDLYRKPFFFSKFDLFLLMFPNAPERTKGVTNAYGFY